MDLVTVFAVAIGLAADAFAVSIANGILMKDKYRFYYSFLFGLYFGFFQFTMPMIGYFMGSFFSESFERFSNWVAFGLLFFIGIKMIYESIKNKDKNESDSELKLKQIVSVRNMCLLALATSIDAGAVGVSFALTQTPLLQSSIIIGVVAFIGSAFGVYLGNKAGGLFQKGAGVVGGVILVLIGFSILLF